MKKPAGNSIFINILHLLYSTVLSSVLNAGALIVLASYLQSSNYGMFSVALAFAMIMAYFTDAGLSQIVLREGSKDRANISIIMSSYIKIRLLLLTATFLLGFTIIHVMHVGDIELLKASYYLIIPFVIGVSMQSIATTYFQLAEKMQYTGIIRISSSVLLILSITLGMLFKWHPFLVYLSYGGAYILAGLLGIFLVLNHTAIPIRATIHKGLFNQLWSFTIAGLLFVILPQLGPIVLERTVSLAEVGLFAVAFRIPQALQQLPFIVAGAFYPVLFRYFNNNQFKDHASLNTIEIKVMGLIGMAMTVPLYYFSNPIIIFLFGAEWSDSAHLLKTISIVLFLQGMTIAMADGLTTRGLQLKRMIVQSFAVVSAIFLYWLLSDKNGLAGAAFACILIELIALLGFMVMTPNRSSLVKKLLPYMSILLGGLFMSDWLLGSLSLLAVFAQYMVIFAYILFDRQLNKLIFNFISKKRNGKGMRVRGTRRVEDGL